jgi:hypothetical protein
MKFKVFYTDTSRFLGSCVEQHSIYRACAQEFESVEGANRFIIDQCLKTSHTLDNYRIFSEFSVARENNI